MSTLDRFLRFDIVFAFTRERQNLFKNDYVWTGNSMKTNKLIRIRVDGSSKIHRVYKKTATLNILKYRYSLCFQAQ